MTIKSVNQNFRYEVVFRVVNLNKDFEETGTATEAILFQKESENALCVDNDIEFSESHANGETTFQMRFELPREYE